MALKIRLVRIGSKAKPSFRIVVTEARSKLKGKMVDILGFYDPNLNPPLIKFDQEKYQKWLNKGAQPSDGLRKILPPEADKQR